MNIIGKWYKNARPMALPQSMTPALLAAVMAVNAEGDYCLWAAVAAVVAVGIVHLAMNLADDLFDWYADNGKVRDEMKEKGEQVRMDKYPYLRDGSATLSQLKAAIVIMLLAAAAVGVMIFIRRDFDMKFIYIALVVLVVGLSYSAKPLKLCYRGLGEPVIGLLFGPCSMCGVYLAACGRLTSDIILISIPVGLLVTNIVYVHSQLDVKTDENCRKKTLASLLKSSTLNLVASYIIMFVPYLSVVIGILFFNMHMDYLFVFLTLPAAVWFVRSLHRWYRKEKLDMERFPVWFGPMPKAEDMRKYGMEWMRWPLARNICSFYCLIAVIVNIINRIFL